MVMVEEDEVDADVLAPEETEAEFPPVEEVFAFFAKKENRVPCFRLDEPLFFLLDIVVVLFRRLMLITIRRKHQQ